MEEADGRAEMRDEPGWRRGRCTGSCRGGGASLHLSAKESNGVAVVEEALREVIEAFGGWGRVDEEERGDLFAQGEQFLRDGVCQDAAGGPTAEVVGAFGLAGTDALDVSVDDLGDVAAVHVFGGPRWGRTLASGMLRSGG